MSPPDAATVPAEPRPRPRSAWRATEPLRWAVGLGALCGLVAGGFGSRLVMRVIAVADPSTDGTFTDAEATVGDLTAGGTLSLLALGTIAGVMAGPIYLGLRRWLPGAWPWKGVAFGVLTLLTVGTLLLDPANADFQIFEPVLLVVALFSALFLVNGLLLAGLMDRFHPEPTQPDRPGVSRVVLAVLAIVCVAGAVAFAGNTAEMIDDQGTCVSAAGQGAGCLVFASP